MVSAISPMRGNMFGEQTKGRLRMFRNGRRVILTAFTVFALTLAAFGLSSSVSAQDAEDTFTLGIVGVNCDIQAPQNITVAEEGCSPAEGVTFTVTILDGDAVDSCVAASADVENPITAGCSIEIPYGATVVVNEDPTTVPAGYEIVQNAQTYTAPDEPQPGEVGGVIFVNLLADDGVTAPEDDADASTEDDGSAEEADQTVNQDGLPKTGIGTHQSGTETLTASLVTGCVAIVAAAGAVALRTRNQNS